MQITEKTNPATVNIDLAAGEEIARLINAEDKKVALAVEQVVPQIGAAIEQIAARVKQGGRLIYFGSGTSGRIGLLDAAEMPPTYGVPVEMVQAFMAGGKEAVFHAAEGAEDREDYAIADFASFAPQPLDTVVSISASGNPAYGVKVLELAREQGLLTIALTSNPAAKMLEFADIIICPVVGPEAVTGSSRMKAGTAQKMVLNMLSTGVMIKLGKTYHNYMIDLQMTNDKLRERALRFVREITGADEKTALAALEKAQNVAVACVMISRNCNAATAREILQQNDGFLRRVLEG